MKRLDDVRIAETWTCYSGSMYGALKAAGMWEDDLTTLMGETGMLFQFIMEKNTCPSGVTVYDWQGDHFAMADRIGIANEVYIMHKEARWNTFEAAQEIAVEKIKASIDRGVAPVVWAPSPVLEFGLIAGYDDEERVLFPVHCLPNEPDPIKYENFGLSEVPIIHVQTFHKGCDYDREKTLRNSLIFGLHHWDADSHVAPNYGTGRKGWENLIGTLERKDYNPFGLAYCMNVYADSKGRLPVFLERSAAIGSEFSPLQEAAELYRKVGKQTARMATLLPFKGPEATTVADSDVPEILECARKAYEQEAEAMDVIRKVVER